METSVNNGMCRCCASEGTFKDVRSTYHWMGEEEIYADMLKECFDILLSKSEADNAGGICEVCITQLRNAANFKKQVLHTEEQFKKHFHNKIFKPIKLEVSRDGDELESDNNLSDDFSTDFDLPIKEEIEEPKPKKRTSAVKATTSKAKKAKVEGETSVKRPRLHSKIGNKRTGEADDVFPEETKYQPSMSSAEFSKHKHNIRSIMLHSNATPLKTHNVLGFKCCFCSEQFLAAEHLKSHTMYEHIENYNDFMEDSNPSYFLVKLDITSLQCNLCENDIDSLEELLEHLPTHDINIFNDIKNHIIPFKFHSNIHEEIIKSFAFTCVHCDNVYDNFKGLLVHMNAHYPNYRCNICSASFVVKKMFTNHVRLHQMGEFPCHYCPKVFDADHKRRNHEIFVHIKDNRRNKCAYCDMRFSNYVAKIDHMVREHEYEPTVYACSACDLTFVHKMNLNKHIRRDHLMERNNECMLCDKKFFSKKGLDNHMLKHTGEKNFTCEVCSKPFGRKNTLREHMRIHMDDRRFKCPYCGSAFIQKCSLKNHLRSRHPDKNDEELVI